MKIQTLAGAAVRCDSCLVLEERSAFSADRRPIPGSRGRHFDFVVPPEIDPMTGKPKKGGFRGVASASNPKQLAALHACTACAPKIKKAFAKKAPELLPPGPLRTLMGEIKAKYGLRAVKAVS